MQERVRALELTNGISEVRPVSFRKLRGPTYIAVIADELAFWYSPDATANAITRDPIAVGCPAKLLIRGTKFTPLPTGLIYV